METHTDCGGCERKIREAMPGLEGMRRIFDPGCTFENDGNDEIIFQGVETIDADMRMDKVTISGYADEAQVPNTVKSTRGKATTLWPYAYHAEYRPYAAHYHNYHNQHPTTHSYETHGSNGKVQGCYQSLPSSSAMVDSAAAFFSDENPHACTLM